jgi:hypothetical protein
MGLYKNISRIVTDEDPEIALDRLIKTNMRFQEELSKMA